MTYDALLYLTAFALLITWPWALWLWGARHFGKAVKAAHRRDDERIEREDRYLDGKATETPEGAMDHYARAVAELALAKARKREWATRDAELTLILWMALGGYAAYRLSAWSLSLLA